jgi:hypothetical protein
MLRRAFAAVAAIAAMAAVAPAASAWSPPGRARVHPGVMTFTKGAQCTADFVFAGSGNVYLGQAAHCAGTGSETSTNGCRTGSHRLGTRVRVAGAPKPGTLVYSSWIAMHADGETRNAVCAFNDLALIRLPAVDVRTTNPSVPGFGGPAGVAGDTPAGATVFTYGNSSLRAGITKLGPKEGKVIRNEGAGWSHVVLTATPGIPGDSGSGFMNARGQALGILSTLDILPTPASNGVGDLGRELTYMRTHSRFGDVHLVHGTEPFRPSLVGAILGA